MCTDCSGWFFSVNYSKPKGLLPLKIPFLTRHLTFIQDVIINIEHLHYAFFEQIFIFGPAYVTPWNECFFQLKQFWNHIFPWNYKKKYYWKHIWKRPLKSEAIIIKYLMPPIWLWRILSYLSPFSKFCIEKINFFSVLI